LTEPKEERQLKDQTNQSNMNQRVTLDTSPPQPSVRNSMTPINSMTPRTPGVKERIALLTRGVNEDGSRTPIHPETGPVSPNAQVLSLSIRQEIQRFESVHPAIYTIFDLLDQIQDSRISLEIRDHVVNIEGEFIFKLF